MSGKPKYKYYRALGKWRVDEMTYIGTSEYGSKLSVWDEMEDARKEVFRLNGWKYTGPVKTSK